MDEQGTADQPSPSPPEGTKQVLQLNFMEMEKFSHLMGEQQHTFLNGPRIQLQLTQAPPDQGTNLFDRFLLFSERTPDDYPYHALWLLASLRWFQKNAGTADKLPFVDYYAACQQTHNSLLEDTDKENETEFSTLAVFTECFKDATRNENSFLRLAGSREHPDEAHRDIEVHVISAEDGVCVYTLPPLDQAPPCEVEPCPFRFADPTKPFQLLRPTGVVCYALPVGWEGVDTML